MPMTIKERKENIRKLPTSELKTYGDAYRKGQVYKFAYDEAKAELKRRMKNKSKKGKSSAKPKVKKKLQKNKNPYVPSLSELMRS